MSTEPTQDAAIRNTVDLFNTLSRDYPRDFTLQLWDGTTIGPTLGHPERFRLLLNHSGAARLMFWPFNKAAFGEAYVYNDIDIIGDIDACINTLLTWQNRSRSVLEKMILFRRILALPSNPTTRRDRAAALKGAQHSVDRDRTAVTFHYEKPADFYQIFLDRQMQYSCGYFHKTDDDIDTAQTQKLEHICRKLRLRPGERLIDIGCGWGGLITYAAKFHGVDATGVTVTPEQARKAKSEIDRQHLSDRCRVLLMDYRNVPEDRLYDKAVSVGFAEHVGEQQMSTFLSKVHRLLRNGGLYLHHAISMKPFTAYPPWRKFALKYVFPDGELQPIHHTVQLLSRVGFEVRDLESLREHYALTLACWLCRLEQNRIDATKVTDEVTYRIYRLYFAGAKRGFREAIYNLYQTLVTKTIQGESELPLTRDDLYR